MKVPIVCILIVSTFATSGMIARRVKPEVEFHSAGLETLDAHESHAAMSLVGQFRTTTSNWLWVRADLYLHNGVEMRPLTDQEKLHGEMAMRSSDGLDEKMHEEAEVTVVPRAERDFRGVFGDIERCVTAYKDMHDHNHNSPSAALPLFRLMTWLDPQFTPGWTTGAHIIGMQKRPDSADKAVAYIQEGISENPKSIALHTELASLIIVKKRNLVGAIPILNQCLSLGDQADHLNSDEDSEALQSAYRYLALVYRETNQPDQMRQVARKGLSKFADDRVLARIANQ